MKPENSGKSVCWTLNSSLIAQMRDKFEPIMWPNFLIFSRFCCWSIGHTFVVINVAFSPLTEYRYSFTRRKRVVQNSSDSTFLRNSYLGEILRLIFLPERSQGRLGWAIFRGFGAEVAAGHEFSECTSLNLDKSILSFLPTGFLNAAAACSTKNGGAT